MGTGFKSDHRSGTLRFGTSNLQRDDFGVIVACTLVPSLAYSLSIGGKDHAAHRRIWGNRSQPTSGKVECVLHCRNLDWGGHCLSVPLPRQYCAVA
jgi:hypothetical protein